MKMIQDSVIVGMANLIESRDGSTGKHVKNTQMYVRMIASELYRRKLFAVELTPEYIEDLCKAAPLHDVGKIKVPDAILQKPGKLTSEEFDAMKLHTTYSRKIIQTIIGDVENEHYVRIVENIAMYHHERWDGISGRSCGGQHSAGGTHYGGYLYGFFARHVRLGNPVRVEHSCQRSDHHGGHCMLDRFCEGVSGLSLSR